MQSNKEKNVLGDPNESRYPIGEKWRYGGRPVEKGSPSGRCFKVLLGRSRRRRFPPWAAWVALGVGALVALGCDGEGAVALKQAPALGLLYPDGKLLYEDRAPRAYKMRHFGVDRSPENIVAYFDAELGKAGYSPITKTADTLFTDDQDKMIRQYRNGRYVYRLYLFPLPRKVGPYLYTREFQHILITKLDP